MSATDECSFFHTETMILRQKQLIHFVLMQECFAKENVGLQKKVFFGTDRTCAIIFHGMLPFPYDTERRHGKIVILQTISWSCFVCFHFALVLCWINRCHAMDMQLSGLLNCNSVRHIYHTFFLQFINMFNQIIEWNLID